MSSFESKNAQEAKEGLPPPRLLTSAALLEFNSSKVTIDKITYQNSSDSSPEVEGVIAKPVGAKEKSHPLIIFNTPGTKLHPEKVGKATTKSTINGYIIPYASIGQNGSIVVASSLRDCGNETDGFGAINPQADEYGGRDVQDVLDIMEIGKQQPEWDGKNVIMIGLSRGAMMTYMAIKAGAHLTGAVIAAGETDLFKGENERGKGVQDQNDDMIPGLKGKVSRQREEALKSRSAIHWPEKLIDTPMLIIHGIEDKAVLPHHSIDMDEALTKAGGTNHTTKIHPNCGHGILMAQNAEKEYFVEKEVIDWCDENVNHVSGQKQVNNILRKAAEAILWNMPPSPFANAKGKERDTLIDIEVERLVALPDTEQQKAIETGEGIINRHKENFKRQITVAKQVAEFLEKKDAGIATDNPFYEVMYAQLDATIHKALTEASDSGKPALITLGEGHHREESIAAEMIALHIGQLKGIKHCITESNSEIDLSVFEQHKDDPIKLPRGIIHLPFAVLKFGQDKGINIVNGFDRYYFSEENNNYFHKELIANGKSPTPPPEKEVKEHKEWIDIAKPISDASDKLRNDTTNTNVDEFISEEKESCIIIMGGAHLSHLARLTGKGNCLATLIDVSFETPEERAQPKLWPYDPGKTVINLADLTKEIGSKDVAVPADPQERTAKSLSTATAAATKPIYMAPAESQIDHKPFSDTLRDFSSKSGQVPWR